MSSRNIPVKVDSMEHATDQDLDSSKGSLEVTGLGLIACLIIAFWPLVSDGTLSLSGYLAFVALLLVGAGALVWRILQPALSTRARAAEPQESDI
jgi:hypothetical protein